MALDSGAMSSLLGFCSAVTAPVITFCRTWTLYLSLREPWRSASADGSYSWRANLSEGEFLIGDASCLRCTLLYMFEPDSTLRS